MASKPIVALNYDFLTPYYDLIVQLLGYGKGPRSKVVALLHLQDGETLVDVGCGTGALLIIAQEQYPNNRMIGVDIDPQVLVIAKTKITKKRLDIELITSGAQELPFADNSIDVLVSTLIFHHLPTDIKKQALKEIYRVMKPTGRFLLADFGKPTGILLRLWNFLSHALRVPEAKTLEDNVSGKVPIFMEDVGFEIQEVAPRYRDIQFLLGTKQRI